MILLATNHGAMVPTETRTTAIYGAALEGHLEILQILIAANQGAPISAHVKARAITLANRRGHSDIATYLESLV